PPLPRRQFSRQHGRRRAANPRPGQRVLHHRPRSRRRLHSPRIPPPAHLHRRKKNPQRNSDRLKLHLDRLHSRRPRQKNLRLTRKKNRPPRRRRQDVRTSRPPPHRARRVLHPRRQPHPITRGKDRRRLRQSHRP